MQPGATKACHTPKSECRRHENWKTGEPRRRRHSQAHSNSVTIALVLTDVATIKFDVFMPLHRSYTLHIKLPLLKLRSLPPRETLQRYGRSRSTKSTFRNA